MQRRKLKLTVTSSVVGTRSVYVFPMLIALVKRRAHRRVRQKYLPTSIRYAIALILQLVSSLGVVVDTYHCFCDGYRQRAQVLSLVPVS